MTPKEIRQIEREHMHPTTRFRYQGRFLVCCDENCNKRFRMRQNGTIRLIGARPPLRIV